MTVGVIGPVIGPIFPFVEGASSTPASNPGTGYDFAINDLFFKMAPTDERPYQRATAQFRKDQFDSGTQAGDQSLTGWWTRGQLSFHKGGGVRYYEVSEGDTVINRFDDGDGLDPFTPGRVSCQKGWEQSAHVSAADVRMACGWDSTKVLVLTPSTILAGDVAAGPALGAIAPAGGGSFNGLTEPAPLKSGSAPLAYACSTSGNVEKISEAFAATIHYTGLGTPTGIWLVKGRLLVSNTAGEWYQLAPTPSVVPTAVASGDIVFTAVDWDTRSAVCDTPGPILVANRNRIFSITLDATGAFPSLAAPIQVGELPLLEDVLEMRYMLGFVVLVTTAGVRVGVVSDSGQVTYGPLLIERESKASPYTQIASYGTRTAVVIDNRIYEIDLAQQVGQGLEFAWVGRGTPTDDVATNAGITVLTDGTRISWDDDELWYSSDDLLTGYLYTGLHRFATLENKRFDTVRVLGEGTSGTITVTRVLPDGTELNLVVIDLANSHKEDVPLRLDSGQEAVGLKFTLTPNAGTPTVSPVLLGYQVRALPEPIRHRMIRVPLLMFDSETRKPARAAGRKGGAWSRLKELEALENSSSIVSFSDFRTGETGKAFVESVEFQGVTPPSERSSGFGGIAFLTLRKL